MILIHTGAGAAGAYAVQFASHAGATVIATASGNDEAYLKSVGANRVIDYREKQFEKVLREKVDVVLDLIGGSIAPASSHLSPSDEPVENHLGYNQESAVRSFTNVSAPLAGPFRRYVGTALRVASSSASRRDGA